MNQSKLTYKEIIEKLKVAYHNVDDFAYENNSLVVPENFEFSNEVREAERLKNQAYNFLCTHPSHKNWNRQRDDKEYQELYKKWSDLPSSFHQKYTELNQYYDLPKWKEVEQYGGEGQGDTWYSVKYFPDHDVYIRVDGFYTSYNGTDFNDGWDCCSEVRPEQKTITVYKQIKQTV